MITKLFQLKIQLLFFALLLVMHVYSQENKKTEGEFSFGLIADCQYCNVEGTGVRKYSLSKAKLQECVTDFNRMDLAFSIHLGDLIDRNFENFDVLAQIYDKLNMPHYHVLGNHDFSVVDEKKAGIREKMDMPANYYDFAIKNWRFVVLDGNDISFHAYPKDSKGYKTAEAYYEKNKIESPKWNGAAGDTQLNWLKGVIKNASKNKENVVIFCHFPVYPENVHNLWNSNEIMKLIEPYKCVKAYISGHNHHGNYGQKDGLHYLTLKGMVDTGQNSYAVIKVKHDFLEVTGFGREENRILKIR